PSGQFPDANKTVKRSGRLPSKNDPANQPESQPADLFSSVETRAMLEEFRELVRAGILHVTPENEVLPVERPGGAGTPKRPDQSASREEEVALLDKQLLEWLERRREQKSEETRRREPGKAATPAPESISGSIRHKVIEKVAQKVLESWDQTERSADPHNSLREQIVDRIADDILRRLQRNLD
ncbi:MAG: hypothetical protein ABIP55_02125, partial [Tepidisphaeraceae bacterium]